MLSMKKIISWVSRDFESAQYHLLAETKQVRNTFKEGYKLYPGLGELMTIHNQMANILVEAENIARKLRKTGRITRIDIIDAIIEREDVNEEKLCDNVRSLFRFSQWAIPEVQAVIGAGIELFDLVRRDLTVSWVGAIPNYCGEGFLLFREINGWESQIRVCTYQALGQSLKGKPSSDVRLKEIYSLQASSTIAAKEAVLQNRSLEEKRMKPRPATAFVSSTGYYPFQQTVLPVARRPFLELLKLPEGKLIQ